VRHSVRAQLPPPSNSTRIVEASAPRLLLLSVPARLLEDPPTIFAYQRAPQTVP